MTVSVLPAAGPAPRCAETTSDRVTICRAEAASRAKCQNNLKQIGLAVHNYHDANQFLPPTYIRQDWATWAVLILPYIEQGAAFRG